VRFGRQDRGERNAVAVVVNFGGGPRDGMRIGLPYAGQWEVILDTSGYDEYGSLSQAGVIVTAEEQPWDNQPYSATVFVQKLSAIYLAPVANTTDEEGSSS
jgi:1,4-alpha-glucan branching enzyme